MKIIAATLLFSAHVIAQTAPACPGRDNKNCNAASVTPIPADHPSIIFNSPANSQVTGTEANINGNADNNNKANPDFQNRVDGDMNLGSNNTGHSNIGNNNAGNANIGSNNTGSGNIGDQNTGNNNIGYSNEGNQNLGNQNTGNNNLGTSNTGNYNNGNANTGNTNQGSYNVGNTNQGNLNNGSNNQGIGNNHSFNNGNYNNGPQNNGNYNDGGLNTGDHNSNSWNTGNYNSGQHNNGDYNQGSFNSGNGYTTNNNGSDIDNNTGVGNVGTENSGNYNNGTQNMGNYNTGFGNLGDYNNGSYNTGDHNIGGANSGSYNNGYFNSGDNNYGDGNSGNNNTGDQNSGNNNIGNNNSGNNNIGNLNTGDSNTGDNNVGNNNFGNNNTGNSNTGMSNVGNNNYGDYNVGNNNGSGTMGIDGNNYSGYSVGNVGNGNVGSNNLGYNNIGNSNTGTGNLGSYNIGDYNWGDQNIGNSNIGNSNTGNNNTGNNNIGNSNIGNDNIGNSNNGNNNIGNSNDGDYNVGNNNNGNNNIGNNHNGNNNEDELIKKWSISPLAFANLQNYDLIEAQESADPTNPAIEYIQDSDGYRVKNVKSLSVGIGAVGLQTNPYAGDKYPELADDYLGLGLTVSAGTNVFFDHYAANRSDITNAKAKQKVPLKAQDLTDWLQGDRVDFQVSGNVLLSVNLAKISYIPLGAAAIFSGSYNVTVVKGAGNKALVELRKNKMTSLKGSTGFLVTQASLSGFVDFGNYFAYELDLNDEKAQTAYANLFKGNFIEIEDLSKLAPPYKSVVKKYEGQSRSFGKRYGVSVATPFIPVLSFNTGASMVHTFTKVEDIASNVSAQTHYGIYSVATDARAFKAERHVNKSFYAAIAKIQAKNTKQIKTNGTFVWHYETSNGTTNKLERAFNRLQRKVGLDSIIGRDVQKYGEKLRYTNITFKMTLSDEFIRALVMNDKTKLKNSNIFKISKELSSKICELDEHNCAKESAEAIATKALRPIYNNIPSVKRAIESGHDKLFVNNLAGLGKDAFGDDNTINLLYLLGQSCGVELNFEVTGEFIKKIEVNKKYNHTDKCLL